MEELKDFVPGIHFFSDTLFGTTVFYEHFLCVVLLHESFFVCFFYIFLFPV